MALAPIEGTTVRTERSTRTPVLKTLSLMPSGRFRLTGILVLGFALGFHFDSSGAQSASLTQVGSWNCVIPGPEQGVFASSK
jgi:hypothetical protein